MRFLRPGARLLIVAAMAMLVETSCSHAPPPPPGSTFDPRDHEGKNVVVRFHTTDGITYVTSQYAVTDSSIVIREILRDPKYYVPPEARLYNQTLTPAPKDITLPFEVAMAQIKSADQWQPRSAVRDVGLGAVVILAAVAFALILVLNAVDFEFGAD